MLNSLLKEMCITVEQHGNTNLMRIMADGKMVGHVGSKDGAVIHLIKRYDSRVVEYIENEVRHRVTNKIAGTGMVPAIPAEAINLKRAEDDIDDFDA